jgi:myo-inositol-1(or 4)-monophosphatase
MELQLPTILDAAIRMGKEGATIIKEARKNLTFKTTFKHARDLLTSVDIAVNDLLLRSIKENFPTHHIISEETLDSHLVEELNGPCWIIDPIDGTANFAHGLPHVATSIAFAFGGEVLVGVVTAPFLDEIFHAIKGRGAFCNDVKTSVSEIPALCRGLVATGFPYHEENGYDHTMNRLSRVARVALDVRRLGAGALDLCNVACGRLVGYYETVHPWDSAAGNLIVKESGGKVGHLPNSPAILPWQEKLPDDLKGAGLVAANPMVFEELYTLLDFKS